MEDCIIARCMYCYISTLVFQLEEVCGINVVAHKMKNVSGHMCLGLFSKCRFILTNLYLKVLHFDILIQLKGMVHFLKNVLGLIKGVCR